LEANIFSHLSHNVLSSDTGNESHRGVKLIEHIWWWPSTVAFHILLMISQSPGHDVWRYKSSNISILHNVNCYCKYWSSAFKILDIWQSWIRQR